MATGCKRALILNNNEEEALLFASVLEGAGYHPQVTWSGLEALEILKSENFDVLCVGNHVPDLYVGEFLQKLAHLPKRPCSILMQKNEPNATILRQLQNMIEGSPTRSS